MNIVEFLYYCIYRLSENSSRKGGVERHSSAYLAVFLATNTFTLFLFSKPFVSSSFFEGAEGKNLFFMITASIFIFWQIVCEIYFIRKGHCLQVLEKYSDKWIDRLVLIKGIGLAYCIGSVLFFVAVGMLLSKAN